jgi:hypothetical protein
MKGLGRTEFPGTSGAVIFLIWGFLSGIALIWLYVAVRPRFGPGARTAALTGFAFWAYHRRRWRWPSFSVSTAPLCRPPHGLLGAIRRSFGYQLLR